MQQVALLTPVESHCPPHRRLRRHFQPRLRPAGAAPAAATTHWAKIVGMCQADGQIRQLRRRRLRIDQHDLPGHRATLVLVRIVDAVDPIVRPLGFLNLGLAERILPQHRAVGFPSRRHGGITRGRRQCVEIFLRSHGGIVQRIAIHKNRPNHFAPLFAGRHVATGPAAIMRAAPVVQNDRLRVRVIVKVANQFLLRSAAAEVLDRRIDEPNANVLLGARPTVGRNLVLHRVVTVFVLDGVFVNALAHDPLFFGMHHDTGAPIARGTLEHVAVGIDREPIECSIQKRDEPAFADPHRAVRRRMRENGVGVNPTVAARHCITKFNIAISSAPRRARCEHHRATGDAFDGDFRALATVVGRIDGKRLRQLRRHLRRFLPHSTPASHHLDAVIHQRRHQPAALVDGRLHDAIVERPTVAVIDDSDRIVNICLRHRRRGIGSDRKRR